MLSAIKVLANIKICCQHTAIVRCSRLSRVVLSYGPQHILWQQFFFRRPTNVSQRLCVVSLAPKQLRYCALQLGCHRIALHYVIIHSIHNNPQSLRSTADNCDCDNRSYHQLVLLSGILSWHSVSLYMLDCAPRSQTLHSFS